MKLFQVVGFKKSGKTTIINNILEKTTKANKIVVYKNTHNNISENKNPDSDYFMKNNADKVYINSKNYLYQQEEKKELIKILRKNLNKDYFIIEGLKNKNLPRIICIKEKSDLKKLKGKSLLKVTINKKLAEENKDIYYINEKNLMNKIVDKIKNLPDFPAALNCELCDSNCFDFYLKMMDNIELKCPVKKNKNRIKIKINGKELQIMPFIENMAVDTIKGFLKNLKGYENGKITINIEK